MGGGVIKGLPRSIRIVFAGAWEDRRWEMNSRRERESGNFCGRENSRIRKERRKNDWRLERKSCRSSFFRFISRSDIDFRDPRMILVSRPSDEFAKRGGGENGVSRA